MAMNPTREEGKQQTGTEALFNGFHVVTLPFIVIALFGTAVTGVLTGVWWMLVGTIAFIPVVFLFIEIRVLCSHCPFYDEDSKILHCQANKNVPKLFRYRPEPINKFEKVVVVLIMVSFFALPFFSQVYGIWFLAVDYEEYGSIALLGLIGIAGATLLSYMTMIASLRIHYCPKCINFSCPLNTAPKSMVDEYLEQHPVMKDAWEKSGYKLG